MAVVARAVLMAVVARVFLMAVGRGYGSGC